MKNLKKIIGSVAFGTALATASVSSADLIKWKMDTGNNQVKIDTVTTEGHSQVGSWNPTPFYGESVEYNLLGGNKKDNDYFGTALLDFFNVKIDGRNNVTDYQITVKQDTNLDGTIDYVAKYLLTDLLNNYDGKISLAQQAIPRKYEGLVGKITIEAIPEPTAMALVGFAGVGALIGSRIKRSKK